MFVAIREVFGLLCVVVLELTFGLTLDTIDLKDRFCETTGEVLLVFTDRLGLTLGGFLAGTTGALADLVCVELLDLEAVGAL